MLLYSSIPSLHLLTENNGKGLMDSKSETVPGNSSNIFVGLSI